jgi:hypothetical protein
MASFLGTQKIVPATAFDANAVRRWRPLAQRASGNWASRAALRLEAVGAVDGLVTAGLEGHARLAIAARAGSHEHLTPGSGTIAAAAGIARRPERVRALGFARRATGRASTRRIVKPTTCVKLLLAAGKHERRIAIAAGEGLVCELHANSREKEVVEVIANRVSYVGAPLGRIPCRSKERITKALYPTTRQYTRPRQAPLERRLMHSL